MAISELWTGTGTTTVAATSITVLSSLIAPTTKRGWLIGVRVNVGTTVAAAGNTSFFQLFAVTNASSVTLGTTTGVAPNDPGAPTAPLCTYVYAGGTAYGVAPTGNATCLWQQELPQTSGSSWEEFPPAGYEYCLNLRNAVGGLALWVTNSVATSTPITTQLVWSE